MGELNIQDNIINYYDNLTFYQKHENDIWITIILIFLTITISIYYLIINYLKSQKNNFEEIKCNPIFMPFVSFIKSDTFDENFVKDNMKSCFDNIAFDIGLDLKSPINFIIGIIKGIFITIITLVLSILNFMLYIFSIILKIILWVFERFQLLLMESNIGFISILEFTNKLLAMLTTAFYTLILAVDMIRYSFQIMALAVLGALVLPSIIAFAIALVLTVVTFALALVFKILAATFLAIAVSLAASFFASFAAPAFFALAALFKALSIIMFGLFAGFMIIMIIALALMIFVCIIYAQFNDGASRMIKAMNEMKSTSGDLK